MRLPAATLLLALAASVAGAGQSASASTLAWEDEFLNAEFIAPGTQRTVDGVTLDFTSSVVDDFDDGDQDLFLFGGVSEFFTARHGTQGGHAGYALMAFDNQGNDPADYLTFTISFNFAVIDLQFSILDIDSAGGVAWDDGIEITYNSGVNIKPDASIWSIPSATPTLIPDQEPQYEGFEAINGANSAPASANGNLDLDFGTTPITDVTIRYFSTDDAAANPAGQIMGISDLFWLSAVPEPGTGSLLALGLVMLGIARNRRARS